MHIVKIAFIFILVGYGTKAGLAPMHTWLPDAHSQSVAPISALLSGVLLKTALYAILRFTVIVNKSAGTHYVSNLMLLLGLLSLIISCGFILVQKDLKRLLAYSSIEHVGIIAIGIGIGTAPALFGALFHVFNHAISKSLMFFGAGNIVSHYKKHNINMIRGVMGNMRFTGIMVLLGVFALTGLPPFSVFISEMYIFYAALLRQSYLIAGVLLLCIAVIFGAFIHHFSKMLFGSVPKEISIGTERLSSKAAFIFLLLLICIFGIAMPRIFNAVLLSAVDILQGVYYG